MQHLQWPAVAATRFAPPGSSPRSRKRNVKWGFWIFLLSNLLWVGWGWHDHAYALIVLQFGLVLLNIRGVAKNEQG